MPRYEETSERLIMIRYTTKHPEANKLHLVSFFFFLPQDSKKAFLSLVHRTDFSSHRSCKVQPKALAISIVKTSSMEMASKTRYLSYFLIY